MSELNRTNELNGGEVNVSDNVLRTIANIAAAEVCGVGGMSGTLAEDIVGIFGKKSNMKGVKVSEDGDSIELNLSIVVNYGTNIPELCKSVQAATKQAIEDMTGLNVNAINIEVVDIVMDMGEKTEK